MLFDDVRAPLIMVIRKPIEYVQVMNVALFIDASFGGVNPNVVVGGVAIPPFFNQRGKLGEK